MSTMIVLVVLVLIVVAVFAALTKKQSDAGTLGFPYQPAKTLFSPAERSFLGVLDQAVGPEHRVFGKVRVADIALVKSGLSNSARQGALNRVAAKHFDFVVCKASDLSVVCAVECGRRLNIEPPCRLNSEPGRDAVVCSSVCG